MKFISFIAGSAIILAGCASQATYPLTGATVQDGDPVLYMSAPRIAAY